MHPAGNNNARQGTVQQHRMTSKQVQCEKWLQWASTSPIENPHRIDSCCKHCHFFVNWPKSTGAQQELKFPKCGLDHSMTVTLQGWGTILKSQCPHTVDKRIEIENLMQPVRQMAWKQMQKMWQVKPCAATVTNICVLWQWSWNLVVCSTEVVFQKTSQTDWFLRHSSQVKSKFTINRAHLQC